MRSVWKSAWCAYGARYVNISCWRLCHRHSTIARGAASREPRLALASGRGELRGVSSGERRLPPQEDPDSPRKPAPPLQPTTPGAEALANCETLGSGCHAPCLSFPSCQKGMISDLPSRRC